MVADIFHKGNSGTGVEVSVNKMGCVCEGWLVIFREIRGTCGVTDVIVDGFCVITMGLS